MANQQLEALVYTNDQCVGCHKCISVCPVLTANHAVEENGQNKIMVDGKQCVASAPALMPVLMGQEVIMMTQSVFLRI